MANISETPVDRTEKLRADIQATIVRHGATYREAIDAMLLNIAAGIELIESPAQRAQAIQDTRRKLDIALRLAAEPSADASPPDGAAQVH